MGSPLTVMGLQRIWMMQHGLNVHYFTLATSATNKSPIPENVNLIYHFEYLIGLVKSKVQVKIFLL
jgi:hypothetical protein